MERSCMQHCRQDKETEIWNQMIFMERTSAGLICQSKLFVTMLDNAAIAKADLKGVDLRYANS